MENHGYLLKSKKIKLKKNEYNLLNLMQCNDREYNKIRKINKEQTSNNAKNTRQHEINEQLFSVYDFIDNEFNNFKTNMDFASCFKHKFIKLADHPNNHNDKITNKIINNSLLSSAYIPQKIVTYIKEKSKYILEYNCDIGNDRTVIIYFIIFDDNTYELNNIRKKGASYFKNSILKIYLWLKILAKYADVKCGTKLTCFIYLTPFKRNLPNFTSTPNNSNSNDSKSANNYELYEDDECDHNTALKPEHVNGGVSDVCQKDGQIIVYRKEEWFKVLIHETMHNYGLDFSTLDIATANKKLQNIFSIQKNIKIYESYCEIWARIMNVVFECYFDMNTNKKFSSRNTRKNYIERIKHDSPDDHDDRDFNDSPDSSKSLLAKNKHNAFLTRFYDSIQHESIFSLFQCIKILNYMGLDYDVISNCSDANYITVKKLYKEETNVFAYYIIVAILLANFNNFILWCIDNNTNLLNFKKDEKNIDNFISFISKNYKNNAVLKLIVAVENKLEKQTQHDNILLTTMRMTIIGGE